MKVIAVTKAEKKVKEKIDDFIFAVQYEVEACDLCEALEDRFGELTKEELQTYKWAKNYCYLCALIQSYFIEPYELEKNPLN